MKERNELTKIKNQTFNFKEDAQNELDDVRIKRIKPVIPPQILMEDIALTPEALLTVKTARFEAENIVKMQDDRLLCIVGPCSIHDVAAAKEYAEKLKAYAATVKEDLCIIMRVYFEKPRTTVGESVDKGGCLLLDF